MRIVSLAIVSTGLVLSACRGSNGKTVDAAPDASNAVKIQDVQSDQMQPGTPVTLVDVVVTATDTFGARTGDLWVEEPEGGPMSGVHIFGADPNAATSLHPGDIVTVTNCVKASFALASDMSGRTETELEPPTKGATVTVTKTGAGAVPMPATVDALAIGKMADPDRSMQWKMWDGVLVTLTNVSMTTGVKQVPSSKTPDPTLQEFGITGVALVESDLSAFPTSGLAFNACLSSVTGIVNYFFDYQVLNRSDADIAVAGSTTACPAPESTMAACSNSIDDDGNGAADCLDNNCIVNVGTCANAVAISAIDQAVDANPTMPDFSALVSTAKPGASLSGVVITAVSMSGTTFWVAANKASAADGGLEVFTGGQAYVAGTDVGKTVDLFGKLDGYNNDSQGEVLTEFDVFGTANLSANAQTPSASNCGHAGTNCLVSELTVAATGRKYVGSLVTLNNVKVVAVPDPNNHYNSMLSQTPTGATAAVPFEGASDIHTLTATAGTCFASITGIWTYDPYNNVYAFEPTGEGTVGVGCL